jgi:DNA-directed RNA polymerase specialized sigma24 family protein
MTLDSAYTAYKLHTTEQSLTILLSAVRSYAGAIVRDYDLPDPDDTLSEIVTRVWLRLDAYSGRGHFGGWVRQVTRNYIFDTFRKVERRIVTCSMPDDFGSYV